MKKLFFSIISIAISYIAFAQSPQSFQYQAVVRDVNGVALQNQSVGFQLSIISGSPTGTVEYVETHTATTNNFGIVTLIVGGGTTTDNFAGIGWSSAPHFLKVEADLGSGYLDMGTTQLLSVPYALYSENAGNVTTYTAGSGISITGNVIDNTSPDQIVNITGNGATSVTGTYPNFTVTSTDNNTTYTAGTGINVTGTTITNTQPDQTVAITGSGATSVTGTYPNFTISSTDNVNDADANPTNEIQVLSISNDTLYLSDGGSVFMGNYSDTLWKKSGNSIYNTNSENVGVGINNPVGRMVVQGSPTALATDPLFEVKNSFGQSVFVVWQDSVQVFINDEALQSNRGGFAISGRNTSKAFTNNYFRVTPDSSRIWTKDTLKGFGVQNINGSNKTSYMQLTPNNYFIGHESGKNITTGLYNNFIGFQTGKVNTSGNNNNFIGYKSGYSNISGNDNVGLGTQSLFYNTIGSSNIAIGYKSMYNNIDGTVNSAVGWGSLASNTSGSFNSAFGTDALYYNISGNYNTSIGYMSMLWNTNGYSNTASGYQSLYNNISGHDNSAYGGFSMYNNTTGIYNVAIGDYTLYSNANGNFNTALGYGSFNLGSSYSNSTALGYNASINSSNKVRIGDATVTVIEGQVAYTFPSDGRFKNNVTEEVKGLDFITKLRPIVYNFDTKKFDEFLMKDMPDSLRKVIISRKDYSISSNIRQTGFIAQEIEQAAKECGYDFNGLHKPENENDNYSVAYSLFTVPLVKGMQEQQKMIDDLKKQNENLQKQIDELKSLIKK